MTDLNKHIIDLAEDTLSTFSAIASTAQETLASVHGVSAQGFAQGNTFTGVEAERNLHRINRETQEGYSQLAREPAIARLVIEDPEGNQKVLYVARKYQVAVDEVTLASYQSSMGRLASLPTGDADTINNTEFTVIEKCLLKPTQSSDKLWDSKDNRFDNEELGSQSISSLRQLLSLVDVDAASSFDAMLTGAEPDDVIRQGLIHEIRRTMSLRDQPILDKFQDEIFRLPINSKLIMMGPPGTGKTTTLIKRLSQKIDTQNLAAEEKRYATSDTAGREHARSWKMFTPTELLKHYLSEAFAREDVPARNEDISTWNSEQLRLARNVFGYLQGANNKGKFILKQKADFISQSAIIDPISWYEAIKHHHQERFFNQLMQGKDVISRLDSQIEKSLAEHLSEILTNTKPANIIDVVGRITLIENDIKKSLEQLNRDIEELLKTFANREFKNNRTLFPDLAAHIDLLELEDDDDDESTFDGDDEAEDQVTATSRKTTNNEAFIQYKKAIRSLARYRYNKRSLPKKGVSYAVIQWLGENRVPDKDELLTLGKLASVRNALNRFRNTYRRYVSDIPASYKAFRTKAFGERLYYEKLPEKTIHVSSYELDTILLMGLEAARAMMSNRAISRANNGGLPSLLKTVSSHFYNQVLVDEATDFSVIQLAAMKNLSTLSSESFFACGDFNQRITGVGIRDPKQLAWIANDLRTQHITAVYRQSRILNELAVKLLQASNGDLSAKGELPDSSAHEGLKPVFIEECQDTRAISQWLATRIVEIESMTSPLPTTAVLVQDDSQIKPLADALNEELEPYNLRADPCEGGRTLGEGNNVRIFSVEHIKGLEFEAVFFVGVDKLAETMPELFHKFLYVGFTRAATYLGLTSDGKLPSPLSQMREEFVDDWC
ncbi:ATP-binding domain-containing protein [uncultured Gilvimarinus sp.]|uniref:ATP-binding domain-containing protein n=1 Tax=uncultured Gilvimarinus sp. TaxID=1689143 RepID=UPI0030DAF476